MSQTTGNTTTAFAGRCRRRKGLGGCYCFVLFAAHMLKFRLVIVRQLLSEHCITWAIRWDLCVYLEIRSLSSHSLVSQAAAPGSHHQQQ